MTILLDRLLLFMMDGVQELYWYLFHFLRYIILSICLYPNFWPDSFCANARGYETTWGVLEVNIMVGWIWLLCFFYPPPKERGITFCLVWNYAVCNTLASSLERTSMKSFAFYVNLIGFWWIGWQWIPSVAEVQLIVWSCLSTPSIELLYD